jgi:hypothetical protein
VPITEEWILNFEFKKHSITNKIFVYEVEFKSPISKDIDYRIYIGKLHFCHQLQNLYFSLTGEELTMK